MPAILSAALLFASFSDDPFCDPLKQIVAAAPDDYRKVTSESMTDGVLRGSAWPAIDAPGSDGGWDACLVQSQEQGGPGYDCIANFDGDAPTDAEVAALADSVAACLGPEARMTVRDFGPKSFGYPLERTIHAAGLQIVLRAVRWDYGMEGNRHRRTLPYLAAKPAHYYQLMLDVMPDR